MITLTVDKASWMRQSDGFYVAFRVQEAQAAAELCKILEDGKPRELTVRQKKRSLDANAYAWTMIGKLAAKLHSSPEEIYRHYIPDVGDNCDHVLIREDAVDTFREAWCRGHLGRVVMDMGASKTHRGCRNLICYYGSSDYDTEQMSRLIDLIVEDCKAQGIDVLSERERSLLVENWR